MPERVRQGLLDDPVRRQVHPSGERHRVTHHPEFGGESGKHNVAHQRVHVGEARLGAACPRDVVVSAHHVHQMAHLDESGSARVLDGSQGLPGRRCGFGRQRGSFRTCLDDDHAERVADDVVDLARDPTSLVGDCGNGSTLDFLLTQAERKPGGPRNADQGEEDEQEVDQELTHRVAGLPEVEQGVESDSQHERRHRCETRRVPRGGVEKQRQNHDWPQGVDPDPCASHEDDHADECRRIRTNPSQRQAQAGNQ